MTALSVSEAECVAPVRTVLGESPLWDPRCGRLFWVDIKGSAIFSFDPKTETAKRYAAPGMVGSIALAANHQFVCARRAGFAYLDLRDGEAKFTPIADPEADLPGNRFNDGKVDPAGGFWAGTMDNDEKQRSGRWWRLSPAGTCACLDFGYMVANGPAFDPERKRVYLVDSADRVIFTAHTDGARVENKKIFRQFDAASGHPDGIAVDGEGCLWTAFWGGGCVRRFGPDGKLLLTVPVAASQPTSLAIVGEHLYITSASIGLDADELQQEPMAGALFRVSLSYAPGGDHSFVFGRPRAE